MDDNNEIDFENVITYKNLQRAFQLESEQSQLYLYYAKIAELEGYKSIAEVFTMFAEGGVCNAHGNLDFLRDIFDDCNNFKIRGTKKNVRLAKDIEELNHANFYSVAAKQAHKEGFHDIASWLETISKLKKEHVKKLHNLLCQETEVSQ